MKTYLLLASMLTLSVAPAFSQVEDDIYYNPKKDKTQKVTSNAPSYYIPDFQNMDVDEYNMRGQYYTTPIDTIGAAVEAAPDFVYTTEIQKYYNPTIVVENQDLLADVLNNSYGNVTIEYNINGYPTFSAWDPFYYSSWCAWPAYSYSWGWGSPYWGPYFSIGWNTPYWGPSWSWGWGPTWAWGPTWGWGPGWGGVRPPRPGGHYASWRPGANRPVGPAGNWAHRPSYNVGGARPARPGNVYGAPGNSHQATAGHRQPGQGAYSSPTRPGGSTAHNGATTRPANGNASSGGYTIGTNGHRYTGTGTSTNGNRMQSSGTTTTTPSRSTGGSRVGTGSNGNRSTGATTRQSSAGSTTHRQQSTNTHRSTTSTQRSTTSTQRSTTSTQRSTSTGGYRSSGGGFSGGGRSSGGFGGGGGRSSGGHR